MQNFYEGGCAVKRVLKSAMAITLAFVIHLACVPFASAAETADYYVTSYAGLIATIAQQYVSRDTDFSIKYTASLNDVQNNISNNNHLWNDIFSVDLPGTTSDLDYVRNNMSEMRFGLRYSGTYAICEFTQTYLTTAAQENYVNTAVAAALSKLDISDDSAYEKIKAVYDYIINNVDYDLPQTKYSAYDALYSHFTVCQGYSLLLYKMLMEAGVPVRFVSGEADNGESRGPHAWNIVKIGQYWYNLDVTWDDSSDTSKYMLKNNAGFSDHFRDSVFNTGAFNTAYPMSRYNYDPSRDIRPVDSISLTNTQGSFYAVGAVFMLSAAVSPTDATNKMLSWSSSNSSIASVDSTGHVTINSAGTAAIIASATDGTGKTAQFTVTAYYADIPSVWAINDINALSARGVIPPDVDSAYRNYITRAEFMALIANVYHYAKGPYTPYDASPFTDISASAYRNEILLGYELGIIDGKGGNLFAPDDTLTRQECAKIICDTVGAITGAQISSNVIVPFTDAALISSWAFPYVRYAYEFGLMQGADGSFNPQHVLSREQAMSIAERMIEKYKW